uniref:U3 small nucleolar ribonucleoprotein protein MPP10 n=2 Tax=Arion vulgaris TaxID=1028688 RepID=A0A0B7ACZ0_9EUPU
MATKTGMLKKPKVKAAKRTKRKEMKETTPHSSLLMMLSSQLLGTGRFNEGLPGFIMRGLDSEQIWQQLELRNEHSLSFPACTREMVRISSGTHRNKHKDKSQNLKQLGASSADSGLDNGDSKQSGESDSNEEEDEVLDSIKKRLADKPSSEDDGFDDISEDGDKDDLDFDFELDNELTKEVSDEEQEEENENKVVKELPNKSVVKRVSVVDDKFFKLADAEEFLDSEDVKEEKRRQREDKGANNTNNDDDNDDDNEEIDIFGDLDSESDDAQGAKYTDFFDPPHSATTAKENRNVEEKLEVKEEDSESEMDDDESVSDSGEVGSNAEDDIKDENIDDDGDDDDDDEGTKVKNKENLKKVSFTKDLLQSDDDDDETEMETDTKSSQIKSTFELKQEQLQAKAREMEEQSLKEVSWELTGEVSSSKRPENSLLDTVMDFQHTSKAAPVITDETTKTLEDYIKQRIKDKTYDDVERKEKPKEDVFEFKKRIVLNQEKSKQSLGELYEQEFLKQQQTETDEVKADPECEKIEKDLNKLFHQLDALSNFRYTPMKPGTEVKIIVNTPAIAMEEVAPVATADSELLAPEEIYEKKKGDLKAADERSSTDKKRARRQKKKEKQERRKAKEAREKVVDKLKPGLGNKYSKAKALKQLEEISKTDRNVTMIKGDQKKMSSSTSFFTQLQEEVQTNAKTKKASKEKKKKIVDASKLML